MDISIKILLSILTMIAGFALNALAWNGYLTSSTSGSIALVLGVALMILGIAYLVNTIAKD